MTPPRISTEKDLACIVHVQGSSCSNLIAINGSNTSNLCLMMMSCSWSQWHTEYRNRFRCLYTDPHEGKNKKSVLFILGFPEIILSHNTKFLWLQQRFCAKAKPRVGIPNSLSNPQQAPLYVLVHTNRGGDKNKRSQKPLLCLHLLRLPASFSGSLRECFTRAVSKKAGDSY